MIEIGILIGTDFNPGIRGVGAKTALKIVRGGKFQETVQEKAPDFDPGPVQEFFLNPPVTGDYRLEWREPDRDGIVAMLCGEYTFSEGRIDAGLQKIGAKAGQRTLGDWF